MSTVSVIIPTFNNELQIIDAIGSVLKQDYEGEIEIIVIDDGSDDDTRKILDPLITNKKINYSFQKNSGPASARNQGINLSKGEYIAFLDADDLWHESKISKQIRHMEANPMTDLILTDLYITSSNNEIIKIHRNKLPTNKTAIISDLYSSKIIMNTPTILFRRKILEEVKGFKIELRYREDHFFLMEVADRFNIKKLNEPLVFRRIYQNSTSNSVNALELVQKQMPFVELSTSKFKFLNKQKEIGRIQFEVSKSTGLSRLIKLKFILKAIRKDCFNWKYVMQIFLILFRLEFLLNHYRKFNV